MAQTLRDRTDYAQNPDKTDDYKLISSFECDPKTIANEFLFSKRQYGHVTNQMKEASASRMELFISAVSS